jgi:hypothetical protein
VTLEHEPIRKKFVEDHPETWELWDRLESLEDALWRHDFVLQRSERSRMYRSASDLIASFRQAFSYKSGHLDHWKRNDHKFEDAPLRLEDME